jgi:CHAD domain-containing protein
MEGNSREGAPWWRSAFATRVLKTMATQTTFAHPIRTLHKQSKALEKALSACLAKASPELVHELRTTIRRFEAQFALLAQSRKLRTYHYESKKLLRHLKKLRRFAGELRDLDVQRDLIGAHTTSETASDARRLHRRLKDRRDRQAVIFLDLAQRFHGKVSKELHHLREVLPRGETLSMPNDRVISLAQRWFAQRSSLCITVDQLHATRKAAKVARYMCEMASGSAPALKMAKQFEEIQNKGGQWHDWLQLAGIAEAKLKGQSLLTDTCKKERDRKLADYRKILMNRPQSTHLSK